MPPDGLHHFTQCRLVRWRSQKLQATWQQYIGVHDHTGGLRRLAQPTQKCAIVFLVTEHRLVIVAARNQMMQLIGNNESWQSRHQSKCSREHIVTTSKRHAEK